MKKEEIKTLYDSPYVKFYDIQYQEGAHYYCASRRDEERMLATASTQDYWNLMADAVSCVVVIRVKGEEPKLLLNWEFRYPTNQYLLSVPAGLIDEEDWEKPDALRITAIRELREETGLEVGESDEVKVINPCVFSTPGLTDEGNALMYISINRDEMPALSHRGAEGSEKFEGFRLVSLTEAKDYLRTGRDEHGVYYPLYTWAALMYFVAGEAVFG